MEWVKYLIPICIILQEIQILSLRRQVADLEELILNTLLGKLKMTIFELDEDEDDKKDEQPAIKKSAIYFFKNICYNIYVIRKR